MFQPTTYTGIYSRNVYLSGISIIRSAIIVEGQKRSKNLVLTMPIYCNAGRAGKFSSIFDRRAHVLNFLFMPDCMDHVKPLRFDQCEFPISVRRSCSPLMMSLEPRMSVATAF